MQQADLIAALKDIVAGYERGSPAAPITNQPAVPDPSFTIAEFCAAERISIPTFWKLQRMGLGPEVRRIPGLTLKRITFAARQAWHAKMDELNQEQAATIEVERLRQLANKKKAGRLSAESDKHVSKTKKGNR